MHENYKMQLPVCKNPGGKWTEMEEGEYVDKSPKERMFSLQNLEAGRISSAHHHSHSSNASYKHIAVFYFLFMK